MVHKENELISVFKAGIRAVDPYAAVKSVLRKENRHLIVGHGQTAVQASLDRIENIFVTGCGKAGAPMLRAVETVLEDRITGGIVTTKYGHVETGLPQKVLLVEAGHPVPDESGRAYCGQALDILANASQKDLVIVLLSGGGSALWPQPVETVGFPEKQKVTEILVGCGADIHEINCVRSHLSRVKGGQAARIAAPAQVIVLVMSDVIGDDLSVIASGPFAPDPTTFSDALNIIEKYNIASVLPKTVVDHLHAGHRGAVTDTPIGSEPFFKRVTHLLCGTNDMALKAAAQKAKELGYDSIVLPKPVSGEAQIAAKEFSAKALAQKNKSQRPAALISGGETTVTLSGSHGKGGRNQEFVLAAAIALDGVEGVVIGSCGTDGNDGPTDAAGAAADGETIQRALQLGLDGKRYLKHHDAYHFFNELDDLIITGPTNTNVMDLQCALIG